MKIKQTLAALSAAFLMTLTGCQLAIPEAAAEDPPRMVGVFITKEPLDLFDMEAYLEDRIGSLDDGAVISEADMLKYGGRHYGTLVGTPYTDENGGEQVTWTYAFPDLDGMLFATFLIYPTDDPFSSVIYRTAAADEGISDIKNHFGASDKGEEILLEANIYLPRESGEVCFYFNPVYETADGTVYLTEGQGLMTSTLDGAMTNTVTDTFIYSEEGESKTSATEIKVNLQCVTPPDRVTLIQMNHRHEELTRSTFTPDTLPDAVTPEKDTAYLLIEETAGDTVSRKLLQPGDEGFDVFRHAGELCVKETVSLNWD